MIDKDTPVSTYTPSAEEKALVCGVCEKKFLVHPYRKNDARFCSYVCYWTSLEKKIEKVCQVCKKAFIIQQGIADKRRFCTRACYFLAKKKWDAATRIERECGFCKMKYSIGKGTLRGYQAKGGGKYCSKECYWKSKKENMLGHRFSLEARRNMSKSARKGELSPLWRGGTTTLSYMIKGNTLYKSWRKAIFERDNYTCQECEIRGGELHADHIKPFAIILFENGIDSLEGALNCYELWEQENGRTLCASCHRKTPTYGRQTQNKIRSLSSKV